MIFIKSLKIKESYNLPQTRQSQEELFKIKTKKELVDDRTKPIMEDLGLKYIRRGSSYEKKEVERHSFTLLRKNLEIEFKDITIIVGDNGSGKTTLASFLKPPDVQNSFWELAGYSSKEEYASNIYKKWMNRESCSLSFDSFPNSIFFGKDIHKTAFINEAKQGAPIYDINKFADLWNMQTYSNGENTLDLINGIQPLENCIIILDEPETSLSIKSQQKVKTMLEKLSEKNQLIIITHSPYIMGLSDEVYCFETKKWVNRKRYINKQERNG